MAAEPFEALLPQRVVEPPELVAPVEPLVPELLEAPDELGCVLEDEPDGEVVVEPLEAPMPEDEREVALGDDELELPDGPIEPVAVPPADPMPDVEPDAVPVPLVPQAARVQARAIAAITLLMLNSFVVERARVPSMEGSPCTALTMQ